MEDTDIIEVVLGDKVLATFNFKDAPESEKEWISQEAEKVATIYVIRVKESKENGTRTSRKSGRDSNEETTSSK